MQSHWRMISSTAQRSAAFNRGFRIVTHLMLRRPTSAPTSRDMLGRVQLPDRKVWLFNPPVSVAADTARDEKHLIGGEIQAMSPSSCQAVDHLGNVGSQPINQLYLEIRLAARKARALREASPAHANFIRIQLQP